MPSQISYFNVVYVNLNGKINVLINKEIEMDNRLSEPVYEFDNVFTLEKSKYGSIVLHKTYYSQADKPGNLLFEYSNKKYQLAIED